MKSALDIQALEQSLGERRRIFWRSWAQHYDPIEAAAEAGFEGTVEEIREAAFAEFNSSDGRCYGQLIASGVVGTSLQDPREERFCWEFVASDDATRSYQIAFSNPQVKTSRSAGSRLKNRDDIKQRILEIRSAPLIYHGVNSFKVLQYLAGIAFADIRRYLEVTEGGTVKLKPSDTWIDPYAVSSVEVSETTDPKGNKTQKVKLGLEPRMPALVKLFEYLGMGDPIDKMVQIARNRGLEPVQTAEGLLLRDPLKPEVTPTDALKILQDSGVVVEGEDDELGIDMARLAEL